MANSASDTAEMPPTDPALFGRVVELLRQHKSEADLRALREPLEQAFHQLEAFIEAHPDSLPALRLLAEVSQRLGDQKRTRSCIQQAELLDPWNLEILIIAESLYEAESARSSRLNGRSAVLDSDITSGSITTEKLVEQAMSSFRLGQLERAYSLAKLAYRIEPDKGHHLLDVWTAGAALDPKRTRRELIRLMSDVGEQPFVYLALGSIDNVMGLYEEARGWLERGLTIQTDDPFVRAMLLNELAYVLLRANVRLDQAVHYARQALELFPAKQANGFIRDTLGLAYLKRSEIDKAVRNLREAVAKDSTVIPRFHLAVALLHERNAVDALAELKHIAAARQSLESPHIEEIAILQRVQSRIGRLEDLLNLGGADDIADALALLEGLY